MFPFPSNGKVYLKTECECGSEGYSMFPFPSNGKAYPKITTPSESKAPPRSFHSLQTGKRIQSFEAVSAGV